MTNVYETNGLLILPHELRKVCQSIFTCDHCAMLKRAEYCPMWRSLRKKAGIREEAPGDMVEWAKRRKR
jgi:recombinational DNA repair protein RecR